MVYGLGVVPYQNAWCLNWEGVGFRFKDATDNFKYPNVGKTNNNGLTWTVEVLEQIYTNASFPVKMAPALNISLKDSGKSRADLWAFATIAAMEYGVETNNLVCDGTYNNNPGVQCNEDVGMLDLFNISYLFITSTPNLFEILLNY